MFSIDELISNENQQLAIDHFKEKETRSTNRFNQLNDMLDYWEINHNWIISKIKAENYVPDSITIREIITNSGKKRDIAIISIKDRIVLRMISQILNKYINPILLPNSFAYQKGKGVSKAVLKAKEYIESGDCYVMEIDIKDYFQNINLELLIKHIEAIIADNAVTTLINNYLYCTTIKDGHINKTIKGIIPGSSISPILSNLYLHSFDEVFSNEKEYHYIRYSDNLYFYFKERKDAELLFNRIIDIVNNQFLLPINTRKSGIYDVFSRRLLGYDFIRQSNSIECRRHFYEQKSYYNHWHTSALTIVNDEYHIIHEGIINKYDYSLIFENKDNKVHIPVNSVNQISIYSDVTITSTALNILSQRNIRLAIVNKYGLISGYYEPHQYTDSSTTLLKQCELYLDEHKRLLLAKRMESAILHNMRANLKYYQKRSHKSLTSIPKITNLISEINSVTTIDQLMLIEARAKKEYYETFNNLITNKYFTFTKRTKRPPKDEINALISFGNTLLYNRVLKIIMNTSLNPRVGIIHATNRRKHSLNLDFADLFKPVIVDRVIFTCINCHRLKTNKHFEAKNNGIYLNTEGKRIFISEFERKMHTHITYNKFKSTYQQLIEKEIKSYLKFILHNIKYKPYKYY